MNQYLLSVILKLGQSFKYIKSIKMKLYYNDNTEKFLSRHETQLLTIDNALCIRLIKNSQKSLNIFYPIFIHNCTIVTHKNVRKILQINHRSVQTSVGLSSTNHLWAFYIKEYLNLSSLCTDGECKHRTIIPNKQINMQTVKK